MYLQHDANVMLQFIEIMIVVFSVASYKGQDIGVHAVCC